MNNNTKRLRLTAVFAVFVLVTGCLCISYMMRTIEAKNREIQVKTQEINANTDKINELTKENEKLRQHSQDVDKDLQQLQDQYNDLKQKADSYERDLKSLKEQVSFLPTNMKIDKKISTVVTAYTVDECGKNPSSEGYGITATGTKAAVYRTVAVDPNVIPLGSTIYIPEFASYPNKGIFHAEDTGVGGLFGVDVLVQDLSTANTIGRSVKSVYILK